MSELPSVALVRAYVVDIVERTHALEDLCTRLSFADDYVSREAPLLIKKYADLGSVFREAVVDQLTKYEERPTFLTLVLIRSLDARLREVFGDVRLPERARSDRVPGVLNQLVAEKARTIAPNASIILRPQWNYNYKIHRQDVHSRYAERLQEVFPTKEGLDSWLADLPRPLYVISFPLMEQRAVHLHSALGHELGHLMAHDYVAPARIADAFNKRVRKALLQRIKTKVSSQEEALLELEREPIHTLTLERASQARTLATNEFAADAASVYLFGLSAVLGASQIALARNAAAVGEGREGTYPPWGIRLILMLQLADTLGWTDVASVKSDTAAIKTVETRVAEIRAWVGSDTERWRTTDHWTAIGHDAAAKLLPAIHKHFRAHFAAAIADRDRAVQRIPRLLKRLRADLPPDNVSTNEMKPSVPDLAEIFNASWWHRLAMNPPRFTDDDLDSQSRDAAEKSRRLTFKAIENVSVFTEYAPILSAYDNS